MNQLKEHIQEEIEAESLADLLADFMTEDGQTILDECAADGVEPPVFLTKRQDKYCTKPITREIRPEKRSMKKRILTIAIVAALLCGVQASAIPSIIKNYFISIQASSVDIAETPQPVGSYFIRAEMPLPAYVPAGYRESGIITKNGVTELIYRNQKSEIKYFIYEDSSAVRLDAESTDTVEKITVNGQSGVYLVKDGEQTLFWGQAPAFQLNCSAIERTELFCMAESVDYSPEKQVK